MTFSSLNPIATKKPLRRWKGGGRFCQMRTFMRHWLAPAAILGSALLLSACAYYPNGPYGPGYGPPPPPPPPRGAYGPPPPPESGPPPGDESGPPPAGGEDYGASGGAQSGPPAGYGPAPRRRGPHWCERHPKRCAKEQQMMQQGAGPNDQGGPPPNDMSGPPPNDENGPPPNDESGPPPNDENGPPPNDQSGPPPPPHQ
jgi:hypothetical protein